MTSPLRSEPMACYACGRLVSHVVEGLAGKLGLCACSDRDGAPGKLRPAGPLSEVEAARARLAEANALRRGRIKRLTDEGRKKMTQRELDALRHAGEADGIV